MADVPEIGGTCDARFVAVRDALRENFRERGEVGAAVAVTLDGRPVVDLWGGWMDRERTRAWQRDTLVNVFSIGKGIATTCLLMLVEQGRIGVDAPVARYWPEFAAAGKAGVTVRMVLAHRAGVPAIREPMPENSMYDWSAMTSALATEAPWWEPGTRHGYHVNTFGFLVGELIRRTSGERIGAFLQRRVAGPLGADFRFGIPPADDARTATYRFADEPARMIAPDDGEDRRFLVQQVYLNPPGVSGIGTVNTRAWRAAEMPSTNGHATARAVARIYAALACGGAVDGVRVLGADTIDAAILEQSSGRDAVLGRDSRFGLGFQLTRPEFTLGTNPRGFGHGGAGGSLGFADPDARLSFAYTMNEAGPRANDPRTRALIDATYASL